MGLAVGLYNEPRRAQRRFFWMKMADCGGSPRLVSTRWEVDLSDPAIALKAADAPVALDDTYCYYCLKCLPLNDMVIPWRMLMNEKVHMIEVVEVLEVGYGLSAMMSMGLLPPTCVRPSSKELL